MSIVIGPKIGVMDKADNGDTYGVSMRQLFRMLQALIQANVRLVNTNTPPGSPSNGDTYALGAAPTGVWAGFPGCIAYWTTDNPDSVTPPTSWDFYSPLVGWVVFNDGDSQFYQWNGTTWVPDATGGSSAFNAITSGTNSTASMIVGTGAAIAVTGTGTIQSTTIRNVAVSSTPPSAGQTLVASSSTTASWQSGGTGTVTSVTGGGIATGTVTTSGAITVAGSGNTTTAATATVSVATAANGRVITADGAGNVKDSGTLLTALAPLAAPTFTGLTTTAALKTGVTTVSFSATPTFNASLGNNFLITLTNNVVSSTLSSAVAGQLLMFEIIQDGTGGRTFVWPTNVQNAMVIGSVASSVSSQLFFYDGTNAYALTPGMVFP